MSSRGFPISPELAQELMERFAADAAVKRAPGKPLSMQARIVKDMREVVERECPFQVGDLVQQVREYSRYRHPSPDDELAMVTAVGDFGSDPEKGDAVSKNDMRILLLATGSERSEWVQFDVESWRFKKYEGEIA